MTVAEAQEKLEKLGIKTRVYDKNKKKGYNDILFFDSEVDKKEIYFTVNSGDKIYRVKFDDTGSYKAKKIAANMFFTKDGWIGYRSSPEEWEQIYPMTAREALAKVTENSDDSRSIMELSASEFQNLLVESIKLSRV